MTETDRSFDLVDRIYEAAVVPELWQAVLDRISAATGSDGGFLFAIRDTYAKAISSACLDDVRDELMNGTSGLKDPRLPRALELQHPGFLNDQDLFTDHELATNEVYNGYFRERGIGCVAGTLIPNPTGDSIVVSFLRDQDRGAVTRQTIAYLDGLRPHLARASMLSFRLGLERAKAQTEALQVLGLPGAVLRGSGRLYAANVLFEALMPSLFQDRQQRIVLKDVTADALLAEALATPSGRDDHGVKSIPIAAVPDRVPMVLHLVPVRRAAHDLFSQATALLVVTPVDRSTTVPSADVLQGLFDLTPAESRLARLIGQAETPRTAAAALGIAEETARTTLRRIFAKTGMRRQAELVSLLGGKVLAQEK